MKGIRTNGWMFVLGLCVITGALLSSGCADGGGDTAAIAAGPPQNPGAPVTDLSGVTQNWDKNLSSASRFAVLPAFNNKAVRDNNTGLVWEQAPDTTGGPVGTGIRSWVDAKNHCFHKNVGGTVGWRLPSVSELRSVQDPSLAPPFVPTAVFTGIGAIGYWSASTNVNDTVQYDGSLAWAVHFGLIDQGGAINKSNILLTWCVRGPMQESVY